MRCAASSSRSQSNRARTGRGRTSRAPAELRSFGRELKRSFTHGIGAAVEVVGRVNRAHHPLSGPVEHLPARAEPNEVLVEIMLVVKVFRKAKAVAERAIDDTAGPPVGRLEVVTVQVMSRGGGHARARLRIIGCC